MQVGQRRRPPGLILDIALSSALKEEVKFSNGGVKGANFDDYKIIRMGEIPPIEVHIVKSNEKIGGGLVSLV
jgi:isoquinoline 1-oxidoreductase beta subunit